MEENLRNELVQAGGAAKMHTRERFKHLRAVLSLPFMVLIVIPALILHHSGGIKAGWQMCFSCLFGPLFISSLLAGVGLTLLVKTNYWFAVFGKGTLAPWDATQKLVVRGVYRHLRNPMISGVFCILLAEALFFASLPLLGWFAFFVIVNVIYIPLFEESSLERRFGEDYRIYKQNVPRWIPRLEPWNPPERDNG
jgi:protein-S-isoprenylcysteine O-methyltransferase Ste14